MNPLTCLLVKLTAERDSNSFHLSLFTPLFTFDDGESFTVHSGHMELLHLFPFTPSLLHAIGRNGIGIERSGCSFHTTLGITRPNLQKTTLRLDRNTALNFWFRGEVLGFQLNHQKSPSPREERSVSHRLCLASYLNGRLGRGDLPRFFVYMEEVYTHTETLLV